MNRLYVYCITSRGGTGRAGSGGTTVVSYRLYVLRERLVNNGWPTVMLYSHIEQFFSVREGPPYFSHLKLYPILNGENLLLQLNPDRSNVSVLIYRPPPNPANKLTFKGFSGGLL